MNSQGRPERSTPTTVRPWPRGSARHVDGYGIPKDVVDDCTLSVALDLWQAKDARNGIVGITDGVEPFRIPTDPLRTAWPKLRAAGLPAGLGIA